MNDAYIAAALVGTIIVLAETIKQLVRWREKRNGENENPGNTATNNPGNSKRLYDHLDIIEGKLDTIIKQGNSTEIHCQLMRQKLEERN